MRRADRDLSLYLKDGASYIEVSRQAVFVFRIITLFNRNCVLKLKKFVQLVPKIRV